MSVASDRKYSDDEPRDDHGQWTDGGGASADGGGATPLSPSGGVTQAYYGFQAHAPALTSDEQDAVDRYTTTGYKTLNKALRAGGDLAGPHQRMAEQMDAVLAQSTMEATGDTRMLYRGIGAQHVANLNVGDVFQDNGYVSTSARSASASDFGTTGGKALVKIDARGPAFHALAVELTGDRGGLPEKEVILPRGSQFRVTHKYRDADDGGRLVLYTELVR